MDLDVYNWKDLCLMQGTGAPAELPGLTNEQLILLSVVPVA